MRLEALDIQNIKKALDLFIPCDFYTLYLFGSRVDSAKKGGDIDLLLVLQDDRVLSKASLLLQKHIILAQIKSLIGEQKIDLVIAQQSELAHDPFLREISKNARRL